MAQALRVKLTNVCGWLLMLTALAGCRKPAPPVAKSSSPENQLPTHAQATLPKIRIYLGTNILDAELATTAREEEIGMMFRTNVTDQSAMLFVFPYPQPADFWMKNCPHPLSAAYIGPDGVIQEIHHLKRFDTNTVASVSSNIGYVLEVNAGWFKRHHVGVGTYIRTEKGSLPQTFFPNGQ